MKLDLEINKGFKLHYASEREKPELVQGSVCWARAAPTPRGLAVSARPS